MPESLDVESFSPFILGFVDVLPSHLQPHNITRSTHGAEEFLAPVLVCNVNYDWTRDHDNY